MARLIFSIIRPPKSVPYLVFITLLLSTILPGDIRAASKKPGAATEGADASGQAVVSYVDPATLGPSAEPITTIAVESERTSRSAMKPDPVTPARRVSQTSVIVDQWPTQVNQGETLMGEFRGSNTGTASGGPFPVTQFKIKVTIPTQLTLTSRTSTMGTWTVENQVATLDVGNFAAGQEFSFTMDFMATGSGDVTLQIKVEQLEFHPGPETFNCPVQITVTPIAYVDASAAGPGGVGNPDMPYPGLLEALDALRIISADDKRICIVPASYPGFAVFDFELEMRTWNGETGSNMELDVEGEVGLPDGVRVDTDGDVSLGPPGLGSPGDAEFHIDTSLEIIRGEFITNGLLDAGGTATVIINRDDDGSGSISRGGAASAYTSNSADDTPRKVKYTGSMPHFTGDEIPGPPEGSAGGEEIFLPFLEIFKSTDDAVITLGKDFTIGPSDKEGGELVITRGILDVGSSEIRLGNNAIIEIRDGEITDSDPADGGGFDFPTEWIPEAPPGGFDRTFRVGEDGIDLLYFGTTDRTVGLEWPPSDSSVPEDPNIGDNIRNVTINSGDGDDIIISLRDEDDAFRINGDLIIGGEGRGQASAGGSNVGSLDIGNSTLEINATNGNNSVVDVHNGADLTGSAGGLLRFIGEDDTDVWVETDGDRLRFDFPAIEVDRAGLAPGDDPRVTFDAGGFLSTAPAGMPANNPDIIGTSRFRLTLGGMVDGVPGGAGAELLDGLDIFDVGESFEQFDGEFLMNGVSSIGPDPTKNFNQMVRVGNGFEPGNMIIEDGEFFAGGGDVEVFGDFCLGCTPPATENAQPGNALFSLANNGTQTVVGDFTVGPDTDPSDGSPIDPENRNRYFLGGDGSDPQAGLHVGGDFRFEGTGDNFDDFFNPINEQGLQGNVFFTGANGQYVFQRQDEDAFLNDVTLTGNGGVQLETDVWQNENGTLTLENGVMDAGADSSDWIILNPGFERDLVDRNNSARGEGVVDLGSRDSYINGGVQRVVEHGNAGGGVVTGGYLFPVGCQGESSTGNCNDPVGARDVDFFRPLILQFPDDLSRSTLARVDYRQDLMRQDMAFPQNGLDVDAVGGGTLNLDVLSDQFWQLEFDQIPSFDPNIRVEADGLPNIFDMNSLRLVQWDCDGTNPRLAGLYDPDGEPGEPGDALLNGFIDSVPNLTQEGVNVSECNIIGIASNFLINPIGPEPRISNPLTLTKSFTDDPVLPGGSVTLEFTIEHDGSTDSTATGIGFTDDLNSLLPGLDGTGLPMNDICGTGSQLISSSGTLIFFGGTLQPTTSCTIDVTLEVPMGAMLGTYVNTTSDITSMVEGMTVTGGPATDSLTVDSTITVQNPLSLTKTFTDDPVFPGGTVTLEFTIGHDGSTDSNATGIAFTDDLGLALSGLEAAGLPANDVCGTGSQLSGTSTLTLSGGSLAPSSTCTFSVTLNVPAAAPADNYPNITSEITSTVNNMAVTGGPASDILQVSGPPQADFSITKTADNADVALDSLITFTITVTNNGPEPGSAMVTDNLPTNVDFVTAMGNCTELNGIVTCNTGVLAVGASESFRITVQAKEKSASSNTATVSAIPPVEDLNSSNNTASVAIKTDIKAPFPDLPTEFTLLPNYPNPFNPTTTIQYEVPSTGSVRIVVIDLMGREVAVLVDEIQPAGRYSLPFDANRLSSGVYLYRLQSSDFSQSRVLIVLK